MLLKNNLKHQLRITVPLLLSGLLLVLLPSQQRTDTSQTNSYRGHLQLDSSTLIINEVASGLDVPWELTYGTDQHLWFTEQRGTVNRLNPETGQSSVILRIPDVHYKKSTGLLGMALHPNWKKTPYVYVFYNFSYLNKDKNDVILSRVVRYTWNKKTLVTPKILLDSIPGKTFHNGSRLLITPDLKLLITTGDVGNPEKSQDSKTLTGKILRINLDGSSPSDNPYPNNPVWSLGHRNAQGLVIAGNGKLYSSEHGPNNDDELNLIQKGGNYGWPFVEGFCDKENERNFCENNAITEPLKAWTPTIAVAGLDYYAKSTIPEWKNSLLLVNLKGQALRVLKLNAAGDSITREHIFFQKRFGRLRDVAIAPNGDIYLCTSNEDWHPRYQSWMYDSLPKGGDRILRLRKVSPVQVAQFKNHPRFTLLREDKEPLPLFAETYNFKPTGDKMLDGQQIYSKNCKTCHQENGTGAPGLFPPLAKSEWVTGDKARLIRIVLKGLSEPITVNGINYEQEMPAFPSLTNLEIANVLTYIRNRFGNSAAAITDVEVYEERKGGTR